MEYLLIIYATLAVAMFLYLLVSASTVTHEFDSDFTAVDKGVVGFLALIFMAVLSLFWPVMLLCMISGVGKK